MYLYIRRKRQKCQWNVPLNTYRYIIVVRYRDLLNVRGTHETLYTTIPIYCYVGLYYNK